MDWSLFFTFLASCMAAAATGAMFQPGAWYEGLTKPNWFPPRWVFPVAWTTLYIVMSLAAMRVAPLPGAAQGMGAPPGRSRRMAAVGSGSSWWTCSTGTPAARARARRAAMRSGTPSGAASRPAARRSAMSCCMSITIKAVFVMASPGRAGLAQSGRCGMPRQGCAASAAAETSAFPARPGALCSFHDQRRAPYPFAATPTRLRRRRSLLRAFDHRAAPFPR